MIFQTPFVHEGAASRVLFGQGSLSRVADEASRLNARKILVLTTPEQRSEGAKVLAALDRFDAAIFDKATMHTPVSVTEEAMQSLSGADCLIAIGGGSTIGLAKAIALRTGLPQIAIPTTFAGSEATPILGQTEDSEKTTLKDPKVQPGVIIYDADLVGSLPPRMVATSALNAIAHAVEGLYAQDRSPVSSLMALEGIRAFAQALPRLMGSADDAEAWAMAQYGTWLCGTVLGQVGMALHHKLCHVLGGSFDLPHAETHSIILPHAVAYNEVAVPELLAPVAEILGAPTAAEGLANLSRQIGAPQALSQFGFTEDNISRAVGIVLSRPYWNPREITAEGLTGLLSRAVRGSVPAA